MWFQQAAVEIEIMMSDRVMMVDRKWQYNGILCVTELYMVT